MDIKRREFLKKSVAAGSGLALGLTASPSFSKQVSKNDIIHVGVIGTGGMGNWEIEQLNQIPNYKVIACCDILPYRLENGLKTAGKGAKGYKDYRKLLENKDLDAVFIVTPLSLHSQMTIDALEAGKHIYCEKTMAYNIEQTLQMVKAVNSTNPVFQLGHQMRFKTMYYHIEEMLKEDFLGKLTHIRCSYDRNGSWRRSIEGHEKDERTINWRMYREYSVGLMAELCAHHIDIINYLLDSHPVSACGIGGIDYWRDGRETFDNVNAIYKYPGGIKATFSSLTTNAFTGRRLQFMGTDGTIVISSVGKQQAMYYPEGKLSEEEAQMTGKVDAATGATEKARIHGEGVPLEFEDDEPSMGGQIKAFKHFADCIYNGKTPITNVETGRNAAIAVHMADLAMVNGTLEKWKPEYSK